MGEVSEGQESVNNGQGKETAGPQRPLQGQTPVLHGQDPQEPASKGSYRPTKPELITGQHTKHFIQHIKPTKEPKPKRQPGFSMASGTWS